MAALKRDSSDSDSEDGATTYRSLAGMRGHKTLPNISPLLFNNSLTLKLFDLSYLYVVADMQTRTLFVIYCTTLT